jgi:plastocyanin
MTRTATAAVLLLAPLWAAAAETGAIKGTITSERRPQDPVAGAVVMVEGPAVPAPATARHVVLDQRNQTFVPHVLAVAVGTTVDFPNHDPMLHNVFSASPAKKFDLGMYGEGESRSVTFDAPGVVRIGCAAHPKMEAFVVVHGNPYLAVSDAHGSYTIEGVPPGTYQVRVWHETLAERTVPVAVRGGAVQPLDVRLSAH